MTAQSINQPVTGDTVKIYGALSVCGEALKTAKQAYIDATWNYAIQQDRASKIVMLEAEKEVRRLETAYEKERGLVIAYLDAKKDSQGGVS